jgi:hypothetical protein
VKRKARVGEVTMIILLFSIVFFVGSIFYLVYYDPWNFSLKQPSKTVTISYIEELTEPTIIENKRLEEAINELKHDGCTFVSLKAKLYLDNPHYLGYNDFKLKALETKLVIISPSNSGYILVVQKEGVQWIWVPP